MWLPSQIHNSTLQPSFQTRRSDVRPGLILHSWFVENCERQQLHTNIILIALNPNKFSTSWSLCQRQTQACQNHTSWSQEKKLQTQLDKMRIRWSSSLKCIWPLLAQVAQWIYSPQAVHDQFVCKPNINIQGWIHLHACSWFPWVLLLSVALPLHQGSTGKTCKMRLTEEQGRKVQALTPHHIQSRKIKIANGIKTE
jgi:hypothetical protein